MIQVCNFNQERDLMPHKPHLSINLKEALESNTISDTGVSISDSNMLNQPEMIKGRIRDNFDALNAEATLSESMSAPRVVAPQTTGE